MKKIIFKTIYIILLSLCCNQVHSEVSLKLSPIVYDAIELYNNEQYVKALDKFIAGIETAEAEKDSISYMACYLYIGNIYSCFSDFNGSIYYFLNGYDLAVKYNNRYIQGVLLSNIVGTYCRMGNPTKAKEYYEKEKKVHTNDKYYLLYNKSRILQAENKLEEALKMHLETLEFATKNNMSEQEKLIQLSEIGNVLVKLERYDEALKYGEECMSRSIKLKNNDLLINAYHILADAYRGKGNIDNSIKYQNKLFSISDTVFNAKRFYAARNNLKEYEDRVVGREMTTLNSVIMRQSNIITWISIFSILIMAAAIIIYLQYRKLRKAQKLLISKTMDNAKLDESNKTHLKQYVSTLPVEHDFSNKTDSDISENYVLDNVQASVLLDKIIAVLEDISVISDPDFSLNTLAEKVGSNMKYVSYVINSTYNKNFKTLLNEYRIREACKRLNSDEYENMTIQAIYEGLGYRNASSFIRAFRLVMGMTPSVYQKLSQ